MPRIKINATDNGFYTVSPLGHMMAPNVFLKTDVNIRGMINSTQSGWETAESSMYETFGITVSANIPPDSVEILGTQVQIEIHEITYFRIEDGEQIVTANIELPNPLMLTATYDQISLNTYGWIADAGSSFESVLQSDGFIFNGGSGDDIFAPHSSILPFYTSNIIRGRGGDDQLTGGLGDDIIKGGTGADILFDPDGVNQLLGQAGDDVLRLGDGSDGSIAKGGHGDDKLYSGAGNDTLRGGAGDDYLEGGRGDDMLYGGRGNDVLNGGAGSDFLKGHSGADQFVFNTEDRGQDRIADFTDDVDKIVLHNLASINDISITQDGNDTVISWTGENDLTLVNFDSIYLGEDDFIFA